MKRLFFLLALILTCYIGNAQTHAEKEFIRMAVGKEHIVYTETIGQYWLDQIKEAIPSDTLCDWKDMLRYRKNAMPDSVMFILTAAERSFIYRQLDKMNGFVWKDNVLKHSIAVSKGKSKKYKAFRDSQESKKFNHKVYTFTKPIFIRNNSVCFFYLAQIDGGELMIYVKKSKEWKLKYTPFSWLS